MYVAGTTYMVIKSRLFVHRFIYLVILDRQQSSFSFLSPVFWTGQMRQSSLHTLPP